MRVLLDEHLPHRLRQLFEPPHEVVTVDKSGWKGTKNGALLRLAQREFDAFVTMDRGIPHQQNLQGIDIGIILLEATSNRYRDLEPLMGTVNEILQYLEPGQIVSVQGSSSAS